MIFMEINSRQKSILIALIEEHIKTAQAVSSGFLVDKYDLDISSATARNEMAELEKLAYVFQPHTSAGRIPSEKAYKYYVDVFLNEGRKEKASFKNLDEKLLSSEEGFKKTAKMIAEISNNAVFWAFHKNNLYYTGISNLFVQPEFKESEVVYDVSAVIDRMEEIIVDIFDKLDLGEKILIGDDNPFGDFLSTVLLKYGCRGQTGVMGILGPMRMDYKKNLELVVFLKNKLEKKYDKRKK
jgi:heat-inducible transcriptional repressor